MSLVIRRQKSTVNIFHCRLISSARFQLNKHCTFSNARYNPVNSTQQYSRLHETSRIRLMIAVMQSAHFRLKQTTPPSSQNVFEHALEKMRSEWRALGWLQAKECRFQESLEDSIVNKLHSAAIFLRGATSDSIMYLLE